LRQPAAEKLLTRQSRELRAGEPVLLFEVGLDVGILEVLEPMVRVRQRDTVKRLFERHPARDWGRRGVLTEREEIESNEQAEGGGGSAVSRHRTCERQIIEEPNHRSTGPRRARPPRS